MNENFRRIEVADPYGQNWTVEYRWQQTAISIRHSDSVDVKFQLQSGEDVQEKVVALMFPHLMKLSSTNSRAITDPWCMKLAALHIKTMIQTDRDMEKVLVTPSLPELEKYADALDAQAASTR